MSPPTEIYGSVLEGGSAVLFARIVYADGSLVAPDDIASIAYSIVERDNGGETSPLSVAGHTDISITPAAVLFSTLQTDSPWTVDEEGYNFRHEIDATSAAAFPKADCTAIVRYELTPVVGQPIVARFSLEVV